MLCLLAGLALTMAGCRQPLVATAEASGVVPVSAQTLQADAPEQLPEGLFEGRIVMVDRQQSKVKLDASRTSFIVDSRALVMLDGHEADVSHLEAGQLAIVMAQRDGEQLVAKAVDARTVY